jgi:hypothetical protein
MPMTSLMLNKDQSSRRSRTEKIEGIVFDFGKKITRQTDAVSVFLV